MQSVNRLFESIGPAVKSRINKTVVIATSLSSLAFNHIIDWLLNKLFSFGPIDINDRHFDDYISQFCEDDSEDCDWNKSKQVYLRHHFNLPQHIIDGKYESYDQFITVETEDGIKLLHIYHLKDKDREKGSDVRLFCDYKTGWVYKCRSDGHYVRLKGIRQTEQYSDGTDKNHDNSDET